VYCPDGTIDGTSLVSGWSATGKIATAKLVSSEPFPPGRYDNDWVVELVDGDGAPIDDMMITHADTFMPFHGHPPKNGSISPVSTGGFKLGLYFQMRGYFSIRLDAHSDSVGDDHIEYHYCLR
jgi:hypothetical protein